MSPNPSTPSSPEHPAWRILLLDRGRADPKWLLATISLDADVRPAVLDAAGRYQDWEDVTRWVRRLLGWQRISLTPVEDALAWHLDEGGQPR